MTHADITTEAVRLALSMNQLRAEYASRNIAASNLPGAQASRPDFARMQGLLEDAARAGAGAQPQLAERLSTVDVNDIAMLPSSESARSQVDEEIADMVGASLSYQTLSQSLSRYFGLMRLATTGRS